MIYVLAAMLIFGVLIAVHELGHFLAARACGVTVHEFAIGMGPAIYQKAKNGTKYAIRILPIGGFCAMEGEDEESDDPHSLSKQGFWAKTLIFAAGALMNFLVGFLIILCLYSSAQAFRTTEITEFFDNCPYESEAGLMIGDRIYSIDGHRIFLFSDLDLYFNRGDGTGYDLVVLRDGEKVVLDDFPMVPLQYENEDGTVFTGFGLKFGGAEKATLGAKLRVSWYNAIDFVRMIWMSLGDLITGAAGLNELSGPVGIVSTITEVGQQSATVMDAVYNIAYFAALIAINLAVMNLLPIPALDGCKILFLVLNTAAMLLFKRQIPEKYENYIHAAGFMLLLGLMVIVAFNDVFKLIK